MLLLLLVFCFLLLHLLLLHLLLLHLLLLLLLQLVSLLEAFGVPYVVAPAEAEATAAKLNAEGFVDAGTNPKP